MELTETSRLALLSTAWIAYFALHSLLASLRVKRWVAERHPDLMPAYRLMFNAVALLFIIPPLAMTYLFRGEWLWQWTGPGGWLVNGIALLAVGGFVWSLRYYDSGEFFGTKQWRERSREVEDQEQLHISPLHRFVRHPWYSLGLLLIWTRDMDPAFLVTATLVTLYFIVGSRLEEQKLMVYHGESYRRYRDKVPGLVPLPWRWLSEREAMALQARSDQ